MSRNEKVGVLARQRIWPDKRVDVHRLLTLFAEQRWSYRLIDVRYRYFEYQLYALELEFGVAVKESIISYST